MAACDIDDLISAFNHNANISQEAIDLAALQAQLSASLMQFNGPCPTTPTMSTMQLAPASDAYSSSSASTSHSPATTSSSPQQRIPDSTRAGNGQRDSITMTTTSDVAWARQQLEDEQDMQMVEDSLLGAPRSHQEYYVDALAMQSAYHSTTPQYATYDNISLASYAAVDPFFAAQLRNVQSQSYFGQPAPPAFAYSTIHATPTY